MNVTLNMQDLAENIGDFKVRTEHDKKEHPTNYWKTKQTTCTYLARFHAFLSTLVVSEAAVERSFNTQTHILTGERNRMTAPSVNMFLFCKVNHSRLKKIADEKEELKVKRTNTLSEDEWKLLALTLTQAPSKRRTRQEGRKSNALELEIGHKVSVEWVHNERMTVRFMSLRLSADL